MARDPIDARPGVVVAQHMELAREQIGSLRHSNDAQAVDGAVGVDVDGAPDHVLDSSELTRRRSEVAFEQVEEEAQRDECDQDERAYDCRDNDRAQDGHGHLIQNSHQWTVGDRGRGYESTTWHSSYKKRTIISSMLLASFENRFKIRPANRQ